MLYIFTSFLMSPLSFSIFVLDQHFCFIQRLKNYALFASLFIIYESKSAKHAKTQKEIEYFNQRWECTAPKCWSKYASAFFEQEENSLRVALVFWNPKSILVVHNGRRWNSSLFQYKKLSRGEISVANFISPCNCCESG